MKGLVVGGSSERGRELGVVVLDEQPALAQNYRSLQMTKDCADYDDAFNISAAPILTCAGPARIYVM